MSEQGPTGAEIVGCVVVVYVFVSGCLSILGALWILGTLFGGG